MCGIAGLTDRHSFDLLPAMNNLLAHRGPDDSGEFIDREKGVGLAMRRLSIIDIEGGKQPLSNEDNSLYIICNGEIYNSPDLRNRLLRNGHNFKTMNSDVEVILHLYEEKGPDALHDLNGMFAFVIYDKKKDLLFGARDRAGIKPFYFSHKNGKFAFASELKSLLLLPWISREIDFNSLYHFISLQFVPGPDTIFRDVKKLSAGHYFMYDLSGKNLSINKYWDLDVTGEENRSSDEWIECISEELKSAVKRWTLSDVPISCSLSGGLDSSSIVGFLAKSGVDNIRTYTLGFEGEEEQGYSELRLAQKVARKWGTEHHEIILEPGQVLDDLDRMIWHLDEPYGGGLPSWYIYKLIGRNEKVALTGTGGDELFGNYGKYQIYEKSAGHRLIRSVKDAIKFGLPSEIKHAFNSPAGHYYPRYFSDAVKDDFLYSRAKDNIRKTEPYIEEIWNSSGSTDPRSNVAYIDFKLQLPEEFLLVTDRFSMAHSVEARTPFLDHSLIELVFQMPPEVRTGGMKPKSLLRQIVKDVLPPELLGAPKKGFILPLRTWTRKELRPVIEERLSPAYLKNQGIFSPACYKKIIRPHLDREKDFTQQVWTLFMFQMWHAAYCNSPVTVH